MDYVTLRRAGGSLTLTIPSALVRSLGLSEGARVGVTARGGKLIAEPTGPQRPRYVLEDLVAQCDPAAPPSEEDRAWLNDGPEGGELI
jgi:antitoxin ChpS